MHFVLLLVPGLVVKDEGEFHGLDLNNSIEFVIMRYKME
jgi:hypothetical protein